MRNPLEKIENELFHVNNAPSNTVLLIADGKEKPQKKAINLLKKEVPNLTTVGSANRPTKNKIKKGVFCLILAHRNGYFIPHPKHSIT